MSASHVIQVALKLLVARGGTCALTEIGQELRRLKVPYTGTLKNIFGAASPYYTLHHSKDADWLQIKSSVSLASLRNVVNAGSPLPPGPRSPAQTSATMKKAAAKASATPPVSPFKFQAPPSLATVPQGQSPLHMAASAPVLSLTPASPAPTSPMPASPMPGSPAPAAAGGDDGNYFWRRVAATEPDGEDSAVFDERIPQEARPATYALLGTLLSRDTKPQQVYLNTRDPFTGVLVGVQGAGKSYTMSTIVEACMINAPPISHLAHPLSTLVFHYDRDAANICELLTLTSPVPGSTVTSIPEMIVLVSSSVFFQKQKLYARFPNCRVLPLLLDWKDLSGEMLKEIMGVGMAGDQLYVSVIMTILRRWQQRQHQPSYAEFLKELEENQEFSKQQSGPMKQRLQLLSSILRDAPDNKELIPFSAPVLSLFKPGSFVIVDSSNPLVTQNEANSVFHVMLQMFINIPFDSGRLVVLDEAHKYLGKDHGELGKTLLECIRQMRHHGLRVIISTQDPSSLGESMLELSTFVVMHCFTAPSWFRHLESALPLPSQTFKEIQRFARFPGHAMVYCARSSVQLEAGGEDTALFPMHVRKRITADAGTSRRHNVPPTP